MIDPLTIDIEKLPWMPLTEKSIFPESPAVYLAVDSEGVVQYIGQSVNPQKRWSSHHHYRELSELTDVRILYLFTKHVNLVQWEKALIKRFNPPLNTANSYKSVTDFSGKTDINDFIASLPEEARYRPKLFLSIASEFLKRSVPPETFRTWRRRIGIKVGEDGCYGKEEVLRMIKHLEFRSNGYTTKQFLEYEAGKFQPFLPSS